MSPGSRSCILQRRHADALRFSIRNVVPVSWRRRNAAGLRISGPVGPGRVGCRRPDTRRSRRWCRRGRRVGARNRDGRSRVRGVSRHDRDRRRGSMRPRVRSSTTVAGRDARAIQQVCRADVRRRVPRELGERLRQLLEPAVVREAAVADGRIGTERDLDAARGSGLGAWGLGLDSGLGPGAWLGLGLSAVRRPDPPRSRHAARAPALFVACPRVCRQYSRTISYGVHVRARRSASRDLVGRAAVVERRDQRLLTIVTVPS